MQYKKFVFTVFSLILSCLLTFAETRYEIKLKSGGKVIAGRYWEEHGYIKCQKGEMIMGFRKETILSITEIKDKGLGEEPAAEKTESAGDEKGSETTAEKQPTDTPAASAGTTIPAANAASVKEPTQKEILIRKNRLKSDIEFSIEKMRQARVRKDEESYQKANEEMNELSRQYYVLEAEVKSKNKGQLPAWWKEN